MKHVAAFALVHAWLVAVALFACGDNLKPGEQSRGPLDEAAEWLAGQGATHGKVYRCESGAMCFDEAGTMAATEEWCWDGDEAELEALLGVAADGCWPITISERWFPAVAGCAWCPEDNGCNAHCGCAGCPPPEEP